MKITAPAGDFDRLVAAIKAGADEVYMGVAGFGARRFAKNFSVDEYCDAIDFAHRSNVSVHLTFNTILSDAELELVRPDMKRLYEAGLDEVIVQDFGVVSWFRDHFPDLPLCASTQLSPGNAAELNWFEERGFRRVVLARELSLDEIRSIRSKTKIELEVFASGALCLGCSGKCYLSSFIGGRSGNRGMCAQPCRQYYRAEILADAPRPIVSNRLQNGDFGYFLSLKDQLQGPETLSEFLQIGVDSIKVEGRMKSPIYVYQVVRYYRDLIDKLTGVPREIAEKRLSAKKIVAESPASPSSKRQNVPKFARKSPDVPPSAPGAPLSDAERRQNIAALFNRGYAFGFINENDPDIVNEFFASNFGVEVGRTRRGCVRLSRPLRNGDGVVFLDETARKIGGQNVAGIRLVDPTNPRRFRVVESAEPGDLVQFGAPIPADAAFLYRTFDRRAVREVENALKTIRRREPVDAFLSAKIGSPLELTLKNDRASATVRAEAPLEKSQKFGVDSASPIVALDRFGETAFYLNRVETAFDPDVFIPKSLLNRLRQEAVAELEKNIAESYRRVAPPPQTAKTPAALSPRPAEKPLLSGDATLSFFSATVRTRAQFDACRELGIRKIYFETRPVQFENRLRFQETFRTLPDAAPLAGSLAEAIRFDGDAAPFSLDWTFNVGNSRAVRYLADRFRNADVVFLSPEISERACGTLIENLGDYLEKRSLTLGLPVFGRLLAMFTQKTLFDAAKVRLTNADDRSIIVEKNAARFPSNEAESNAVAPPICGSSLYLPEPLDLRDAIPWILRSGIGEVRFDFTDETASDVRRIVKKALASPGGKYSTFSFGYSRGGIF